MLPHRSIGGNPLCSDMKQQLEDDIPGYGSFLEVLQARASDRPDGAGILLRVVMRRLRPPEFADLG